MTKVAPGTVWLDGRPPTSAPHWRRVVHVAEVDSGHVYGTAWWQFRRDGGWAYGTAPKAHRQIRVSQDVFLRRWILLEVR